MEQTPYLKTTIDDERDTFNQKLTDKLTYIHAVQQAINDDDDRKLYQLLDNKKYVETIEGQTEGRDNRQDARMVDDILEELSHHLAMRLIAYLSEKFPFFYYEEDARGVYQLYFGNWWDRRHFGLLDPLTVNFIFDDEEYQMLSRAVELAESGRRYHTDVIEDTTRSNEALQRIVDQQSSRNEERVSLTNELEQLGEKPGMFESQEVKNRREQIKTRLAQIQSADEKAVEVPKLIAENNAVILNYSKEDTILIYEQRAINEQFENFAAFKVAVANLYHDYVSQLPASILPEAGGQNND
ncbi:hypothetical protein H9L19_04985 [Weissella diestrammenae]|uniref:Exonuclease SbcC n=1 Tax=Weissella diestrammenae TaxID=1162633 RepID=A0A7G9T3U7_9LACO|nr:hypothetical protein [Weissella diestrammenae]MCM0582760.1 hypothetical protein [Weissella diestrammenae]QNN74772.1 hypothetical protein H9L19_04985 [Weissella diestrammenae]